MLAFFKILRTIYYGLGQKLFEKALLPNLRDVALSANKDILFELIRTIRMLPIKSEEISSSISCFKALDEKCDVTTLMPYINPLILTFVF